ncbi:hypothetical protein V3C99_004040 [Haemonchus contortus]|uniref:G_PROTEIN_RECEP_F1_2 domain-containing protein n=1 Tax=Haemonchus contortus TaxID=6289 RepID=A0A7I4XXH8_HAECO|nr:7TM GPCR domain containing protein [Haemonchus contortus]
MSCMGLALNASELDELREYYRQILAPFTNVFSQIHSYLYVFLCVVGVFANIAIVVVLLRPAMRRSPFNLFLICIAICDATLMATYLLFKHVEFCHPWFFSHVWMIYTRFYAMFSVFVHSASLWFTVNMAVMRYLVLYRGSHAHSRLPPCNGYPAACVAIIVGAVIALIGSLPNMLRYRIKFVKEMPVPGSCLETKYHASWDESDTIYRYDLVQPTWWNCQWERINFWVAACVLKLVPCVLLTVFMTLLVRMLIEARERRLRLCGGVPTGNSQAERTTAMLTGIVAVFLITELPQGILGLAVGINPRMMFITVPLGNFFDLLSLINSAVNFVLCALMSHVFRREFLHTFSMCCPQSSENHSGAPITKPCNKTFFSAFTPKKAKDGFVAVPTNDQLQSNSDRNQALIGEK